MRFDIASLAALAFLGTSASAQTLSSGAPANTFVLSVFVSGASQMDWAWMASPLSSLDWQLHIYGRAPIELLKACADRALAAHVFAWHRAAQKAGLEEDAMYLVRPDGYVALAETAPNAAALFRYLDAHGFRFGPGA
jgi:hypothetical protein